MLCMSISAPFWIHGKAIREAVCNQLAELRRKAHFEFSVNAHYIFSGESCDFCKAEITAFKTAGSESEREQHFLTFKMPRRAQSFSVNRLRFSEKLLSALFASRKKSPPVTKERRAHSQTQKVCVRSPRVKKFAPQEGTNSNFSKCMRQLLHASDKSFLQLD